MRAGAAVPPSPLISCNGGWGLESFKDRLLGFSEFLYLHKFQEKPPKPRLQFTFRRSSCPVYSAAHGIFCMLCGTHLLGILGIDSMPNSERLSMESRASTALLVAVIAAASAVAGNALVAWINGEKQREVEERRHAEAMRLQLVRSQHERILEIIRTGNVEKAAENLKFAVEVGLITEHTIRSGIEKFLANRKGGAGPALPPVSWNTAYPTYSGGTTCNYNYHDGAVGSPKKEPSQPK